MRLLSYYPHSVVIFLFILVLSLSFKYSKFYLSFKPAFKLILQVLALARSNLFCSCFCREIGGKVYSYPHISETVTPILLRTFLTSLRHLRASNEPIKATWSALFVALDPDLRFWSPCSLFSSYLRISYFSGPGTPLWDFLVPILYWVSRVHYREQLMLLKFIPSPPPLGLTFPLAEKSQAVRFLHSMARLKLFSPSFRCTL